MKQLRIYMTIIALVSLFGCQTAQVKQSSNSLPVPPSGFSWVTSAIGIGSFLKPDGWYVSEETKGDTKALFISRENINSNSRFEVGLSVNQINNWSAKQSIKPSQYAKSYATKIAKTGEVIKQTVVKGNFPDMNLVRIKGNNNGVSTIVHHIAIGMDDTDKVYLLSFEAPESQWEQMMEKGGPMLNFFILGD